MDTHLDLVATIGLHFTQLVHQVQPGTFRRHIHDTVPHVHAVLDKLVRAVRIQHRVSFLLVLPEVMLARGTDIFDSRPRNDGTVVVMADKDLVERREYPGRQFLFRRLCQCPVDTLMDVEEVLRFSGKRFRSQSSEPFGKRAVFRKIAHYMERELPFRAAQGQVLIHDSHIRMPVEDMTISAQGFLVHLVVVPFRQRDMNVMVRGGYKHIPDGQQDIECLGGTGKEQVSSDNHFPDIPFPANSHGLLPVGLECRDVVFRDVDVIQ